MDEAGPEDFECVVNNCVFKVPIAAHLLQKKDLWSLEKNFHPFQAALSVKGTRVNMHEVMISEVGDTMKLPPFPAWQLKNFKLSATAKAAGEAASASGASASAAPAVVVPKATPTAAEKGSEGTVKHARPPQG